MTTIGDRMVELAQRLTHQTNEGRVAWTRREDNAAEGVQRQYPPMRTTLQHGGVEIVCDDRDGRHPYTLSIFDPGGELIDEINTATTRGPDYVPETAGWERVFADLYVAARQSTVVVDPVLQALIDELDD